MKTRRPIMTRTAGPGSRGQETAGYPIMDENDFSEDTTYKQQEDLPYDGDFSQMNICNEYKFTSNNVTLDVIPIGVDPQVNAAHAETYRNTANAMTWDKITENAANKKCDKENKCTMSLHVPVNKGAPSKSNISDTLLQLHNLSKEQLLRGQVSKSFETFPETSHADRFDEAAIIKNIISRYVKNSCPKAQTIEFTDQLNPKRDVEKSIKPSCSPILTKENTCDLEKPVVTTNSNHQENLNFLTKIKGASDKQKSCQGQTPQKQLTEKASSSNRFPYGQGQVHFQLPDFSKVAPKGKIPKNHIINKSLIIAKQVSFSPKLRNKTSVVQDILETMFRSNYFEKQHPEQKGESTKPSQQTQMEPTEHNHQDFLTGLKTETNCLKLSSTSQKEPSSSTYIFQRLSQGQQMCQKLKEQTDQLKTKVQEFSKKIKQDSFCYLKDRRMVLEKLQGQLEVLKQEFLATKKHLALQSQIQKHECSTIDDFDPDREVEGEVFKVELLLEDVKEKIDKSKCTLALSLPASSPIILDDLASTATSSSNEEDPSSTRGRQKCAEMMAPSSSCTFCSQLFEWKQKMGKKGHRQIDCGRFPIVIHERALHLHSIHGSDTEPRFCSDFYTGAQRNKCEDCGNKVHNSQRVCSKELLKEFHYRYNTPGQNYLNHSRRVTSVQSSDENKNSSPFCPKPKRICSQRVNSKSLQGEQEPTSGKIPESKSLCDFNSPEETESKILNSALDHALKTATVLKKTTDQMIKSIAEDLAKVQKWKTQLKYY